MKKNKKKQLWFQGTIIFLFTAAAIVVFLSVTRIFHRPSLLRVLSRETAEPEKINLEFEPYHLQADKGLVSLNADLHITSLKGTVFPGMKNGQKKRSVTYTPRLSGQIIMDFYFFMPPDEDNPAKATLIHTGKNRTDSLPLKSSGSFERYQLPLSLEKSDTIEIIIEEDDKNTVCAVSHPVFYRPREKTKPDLVFLIVADTLRWDSLGIYNKSQKCSPNIDAFAGDAVVFDQAYSTASWTLPAHMSLFTGLYPDGHDINYDGSTLDKNIPVLFESLQKKFLTYSYNGNHFVSRLFGFARGFDIYIESLEDPRLRLASKILFDKARELVLQEKHEQALYFLHTYQTHSPFLPEVPLAKNYYADEFDSFRYDFNTLIKRGKDLFKKLDDSERHNIRRIYDAGIYTFDFRFGHFLQFLKQKGFYKNSMIILLSDHGEEFHDHGAWEHSHSLYNELIKIPLLIKFPENAHAGQRVEAFVSIVDVLPTIMDFYGIKSHKKADIDGISLLKTINGKTKKNRKIISYLAPSALRFKVPEKIAVLSNNIKFILQKKMTPEDIAYFETPPPPIKNEMFDIFADPGETVNIINSRPVEARRLLKFIESLSFKEGKREYFEELKKYLRSLGYL
ncbi:MAG: sulfatase [Candidatus Aminicenantes bacterium]|nr:sulfatase [Candidatus Aminicenantes bacterium]